MAICSIFHLIYIFLGFLGKQNECLHKTDCCNVLSDCWRHLAVVLASVSTHSGTFFYTDDKNTHFEIIHIGGVFSKLNISKVDLVYNEESMVNDRNFEDFQKIFKK